MLENLHYKLFSGKNSRLIYNIRCYVRRVIPKFLLKMCLKSRLAQLEKRSDKDYILQRVDYYNRLQRGSILPNDAPRLAAHRLAWPSVYFHDTYEFTRWFPQHYQWGYCPGDVTYVPDYPSIVKSRPLGIDNKNSVIMKLNKVRHFLFVDDKIAFADKKDMVIFRGEINGKPRREMFMNMYYGSPMCNLGEVSNRPIYSHWHSPKMTIRDHLDYKFIMSLEGNDVASNLKWVMSSNSIAVMPRPTCETWFMEETLIPNYHYIEIKSDYSDLEERLNYYIEHQDEALKIIENAHRYVEQFKDKKRENLISLLVLDKYFKMTGQS